MSSTTPRILGVIPARLASTRLPRKVLRDIAGEPMLAWVYRAAKACPQLDEVIVATDSAEVQKLCDERGWRCLLTSPDLPSGTDRLCAVSRVVDADIYVNIQGDEPLLLPDHITAILARFTSADVDVTTPKVRCALEDIANPNAVKVVSALDGRALYFSRSTIPYDRDGRGDVIYWKHLGLYAYRRAALERFAALAPTALELSERLEQLRLLENGISIYVAETAYDTIGVDTEDDRQRVEAILLKRGAQA
ncbi:MAG TPA: 3-deoxy-manno-octulosonate cytidylyltransferase [Acidobacteriaceae bacterium]|nr:3-deoxy-manno-octulosonate cytidylyltransferase [Acidobacteriaceae bacterium]